MEGEGSCSASANKDLRTAREMYETRTLLRNKHKIIDLEAMVHGEEKKKSEEDIVREVVWLQDPGTVTKRASQFVRTQAESWRMKAMLAQDLSMQADNKELSQNDKPISEAQMQNLYAIYESLDFKVTAVHEGVDTISKKLTVLIKILRQTLDHDSRQIDNPKHEQPDAP